MTYNKFYKISLFFLLLLFSNFVKAEQKIVYIDINFVMNNSLAGKSVKIKLDKMNKSNTEKFKKIEVNLKTKESKIVSQKKILNENEYIKKVDSFKIEVNDFNLKKQKAINEINLIQNNSQKKLTAHLTTILTDYSKKILTDLLNESIQADGSLMPFKDIHTNQYYEKIIKPTEKEIKLHKEYLKGSLKKNFFN